MWWERGLIGFEIEESSSARKAIMAWAATVDAEAEKAAAEKAAADGDSGGGGDTSSAASPAAAPAVRCLDDLLPPWAAKQFPVKALFEERSIKGLLQKHFGVKPDETREYEVTGVLTSSASPPLETDQVERPVVVVEAAAVEDEEGVAAGAEAGAETSSSAKVAVVSRPAGEVPAPECLLGARKPQTQPGKGNHNNGQGEHKDGDGSDGSVELAVNESCVRLYVCLGAGKGAGPFLKFKGTRRLRSKEETVNMHAGGPETACEVPPFYAVLAWSDHPASVQQCPQAVAAAAASAAAAYKKDAEEEEEEEVRSSKAGAGSRKSASVAKAAAAAAAAVVVVSAEEEAESERLRLFSRQAASIALLPAVPPDDKNKQFFVVCVDLCREAGKSLTFDKVVGSW
jgi:hypothetical protein